MVARIDTSVFSLDSNDDLLWRIEGTQLVINAQPGHYGPEGFAYIAFWIANYHGPDTYTLGLDTNRLPSPLGFYGTYVGSPPVPGASYQTLWAPASGGTIRIIAGDTTRGFVGEFSFLGERNDGGTGLVRVWDGSFRVRYHCPTCGITLP